WTSLTPMPTTRYGLAAVVYNGQIYALGGRTNNGAVLNTLEVYSIAGNSWRNDVAQMPRARYGFNALLYEDRIYLIGGENAEGQPIAEVDIYRILDDTWIEGAPMPTPRAFLGAALNTNIGSVPGGYTGIVAAGGRTLGGIGTAVVEEYIIDDNAWRTRSPLEAPRHSGVALALERPDTLDDARTEIWWLGGQVSGALSNNVTSYTQEQDYVRRLTPMPNARYMHAAVEHNGLIYLLGGRNFQEETEGFVFDPETEQFTPMTPLPSPQNGLSAVEVDGDIYAIGGTNNFGVAVPFVRVYDPFTQNWSDRQAMQSARRDAALAVLGNDIYVIGGFNNGALQTVEIYNTLTDTWRSGPLLDAGRTGSVAAVYQGIIYLFGGTNNEGQIGNIMKLNVPAGANAWESTGDRYAIQNPTLTRVHDNRALIVGGRSQEGTFSDRVFVYQFDIEDPSQQFIIPGNSLLLAADFHAASYLNGQLYLFGGNTNAANEPPGLDRVQKLNTRCFNGLQDGRESGNMDTNGGCPPGIAASSEIRLVGGDDAFSGRLEVFANGQWGTVCDDSWGSVDSRVACTQYLGAPATGTFTNRNTAPSSTPIWLDNVTCTGNETRLLSCPNPGIGVHNCAHSEDVHLVCRFE
ncbi:MAG: kelch repeat-containing protein, partial [Myxococcota bacterium]